jgi:hypothetical protein
MKRFLLWDYRRASWQYDLMVGVILAFIFLTPREFFRDQPRPASIVMVPTGPNSGAFWIEPDLISGDESQRFAQAGALLKNYKGKKHELERLETILDAEQEVKGYMAFTKP